MTTYSEALEMAVKASQTAARAEARIDMHEKVCAERWGLVIKLGLIQLSVLISMLGALLFDKFMQ